MKARIIIALVLMLVIVAGTGCQRPEGIPVADPAGAGDVTAAVPVSAVAAPRAAEAAETTIPAPTDTVATTRVVVYYFHRTIRCETCLKFEALTETALRDGFAGELASGRITWRVLDFEAPENESRASKYDVFESSVVVSRLIGETEIAWKKLQDIWGLVGDESAFIGYIQKEAGAYLGGAAHGE